MRKQTDDEILRDKLVALLEKEWGFHAAPDDEDWWDIWDDDWEGGLPLRPLIKFIKTYAQETKDRE